MTAIGFLTLISWLAIAGFLYLANRDLCSPVKIAHVFSLYFYLAFYLGPETDSVTLIYINILLTIFILGLIEAILITDQGVVPPIARGRPSIELWQLDRMVIAIWLMTCLPIFAQAYIVQSFGGLTAYFVNLAFRVRDFAGLGPVIAIVKIMPVLNIVYFGLMLCAWRPGRVRWFLFGLSTLLTVLIGVFAGSRSAILMNLLLMALIYNYMRRPFRLAVLLTVAIPLVFMGFFLGVARSKVKLGDFLKQGGEYSVDLDSMLDKTAQFRTDATANTGLIALRLITEQGVPDPQYGKTFLAAFTNIVPRDLWPDKPKTGGVVLTEDYTGNAWGGLSNLSTGIIAEGMLNFGIILGSVVGFALFGAMMFALIKAYVVIRRGRGNDTLDLRQVFYYVVFVWCAQFVPALLVSEFANASAFLLIEIVILYAVYQVLKFVSRPRSAMLVSIIPNERQSAS